MDEFITVHLNLLSIKHTSYIRDTSDFLGKVQGIRIGPDSSLFSMDVESLCTNTEIERGLEAVAKCLRKHPMEDRPDQSIRRNDFGFNGRHFLQINGTAMGKRFAPAYANIYMADWEESVFLKCKSKPSHYWRYLDDIWGVWEGTEECFRDFVEILNQHHPSIRVKVERNEAEINFLDTTVFKGPGFQHSGRLDSKVYFKSTDTHALLHHGSDHHPHIFKGIVKAQLVRFRRICTREGDRVQAVKTLFEALRRRGYSRQFLRMVAKEKAAGREGGNTSQRKRILPLVVRYSGTARGLALGIQKNFSRLTQQQALGTQYRVVAAYKRGRNLYDMLVHSELAPASGKGKKKTLVPRDQGSG